jgi:cobalt-zinc-cadmium efflux system outer membrane protein
MKPHPHALTPLLMLLFCVLCPSPARAAGPLPPALTLAEALAHLRSQSATARLVGARVDVVQAAEVGAGLLENPTLAYGGLALVAGANTGALYQHDIQISQAIPLSGQRAARVRAAARATAAARGEGASLLHDAASQVREAFMSLLAAQRREGVLGASLASFDRLVGLAEARVTAGAEARFDLARLALERRRLAIDLDRARAERRARSRGLASLLGAPDAIPEALGDLPQGLGACGSLSPAERVERHPRVTEARLALAAAQAKLAVAHRERLPVPTFSLGAVATHREDSGMVQFGVALPLPLHDRGQGPIAVASAEVIGAEQALEVARLEVAALLERGREAATLAFDALERHGREVVAMLPGLVDTALAAWQAGALETFSLIDVARAQHEATLEEVELAETAAMALAGLAAAAGLDGCDSGD